MAKIMTVRAPDDLQNELKNQAKKLGYPRNALVLQILQDWVKKTQLAAEQKEKQR